MIKKIIIFFLILTFLFEIPIIHSQYNLYYTKLDTLQMPIEEYKYSTSIPMNLLKVVIYTSLGGILGLGMFAILKSDENGETLDAITGWMVTFTGAGIGFLTGVIKTIIDEHKRKNFGYDKEGLIKYYKLDNSYKNIILISYALASLAEKSTYQFLVNEAYKFHNRRDNRPSVKFLKSFNQIIAYAALMNNYNLYPILSSKFNIENKQLILNNIPFCINLTLIDSAYKYLKNETKINRQEEYDDEFYLSDSYCEMITAHLLTRRNENDSQKLIQFYKDETDPKIKLWLAFALADYKYDRSIETLIDMYNSSDDGNLRFYALVGLANFDTPEVREVMKRALEDEYVPPNKIKSNDEERFIIREFAEKYLSGG